MVHPAGKSVIIKPAPSTPQASQNAGTCWFKPFELYRLSSFSLDDDDSRPYLLAADKLTDLQFDDVTTAQLAVDGEVKHGAVAYAPLSVEPETDGPNLLRFESALGAELRPAFHGRRFLKAGSCCECPISHLAPGRCRQGGKGRCERSLRSTDSTFGICATQSPSLECSLAVSDPRRSYGHLRALPESSHPTVRASSGCAVR
jgi:hypothetical protein